MTKLGIIGDPHAKSAPVREALSIFQREGVGMIWCVGDIAGYGDELDATVDLLRAHDCVAIRGNHEQWALEKHAAALSPSTRKYIEGLRDHLEAVVEGVALYMVHASPPRSLTAGIRLLDIDGRVLPEQRDYWAQYLRDFPYQVLLVGHTHQVFSERLGNTLVINPGSCQFNNCCGILSLPELECEWIALSGREVIRAWNWGVNLGQA